MSTQDNIFENLIARIENVAKNQAQLAQKQADVNVGQERVALELLGLASEMNKQKFKTYANKIENCVVQYLLNAPYDAKKAYSIHKDLFAERHEMAMFLYENLDEIRQNAYKHIQNNNPVIGGKIKVFTYWDDDNKMPPVVSLCRENLKRHISPDKFDLIILNSENYKDWTDFRKESIKSEITQAQFTDILRSKLLESWGGFWVDATDMLTCDFYQATKHIREQDYFIFTYNGSRTGTWFMYSKPNSYIISMVSASISLWWEKKNYLTNYFMIHDIIEMLYWVDAEYRKKWDNMLKIHPQQALVVFNAYHKVLGQQEFESAVKGSFVHKLTYKYDSSNIVKSSVLERVLDNQMEKITSNNCCLDLNFVKNKTFVFSRQDGSHARTMKLDDSGLIKNIGNNGHKNEYCWAIEQNLLVFKNFQNEPTDIFSQIVLSGDGELCIVGYYKANPALKFKLLEVRS